MYLCPISNGYNCWILSHVETIPFIWSSLLFFTELFSSSSIFCLRRVKEESDLHRIQPGFAEGNYGGFFVTCFPANPQTSLCLIVLTVIEHWALLFTLSATSRHDFLSMLRVIQDFVLTGGNFLHLVGLTLHLLVLKSTCHVVIQWINYH